MGKPYFIQAKAYICHRTPEMVLAGIWLVGLLAGGVSFSKAGIHYFLLMRSAVFCSVSIVGLFACNFLPFLLSAFAVFFNKPRLLYWICFFKAFIFAGCSYGIMVSFGSAHWLVRLLLQFSDCCLVSVLCWFCLRHINGNLYAVKRDCIICTGLIAAVGMLDYCVVSPFLARLADF